MSNLPIKSANKSKSVSVAAYLKNDAITKRINELLGARAGQFTTSLITAVNESEKLAECEPRSVLNAALTASSMDLPINQNLGFAYLVPYRDNRKGVTLCQFQMGYKGFVQLAQRSGFYKTINASDVREGEIVGQDRLSGEIEFKWIEDDAEREQKPIAGYVAYIKMLNGFEKTLYWSKEKVLNHAQQYSKSFAKYGTGLWKEQFDLMAKKTVLKSLLNGWGILSTELQTAIKFDQTIDGEYDDNPKRKPELTQEEREAIEDEATNIADELIEEAESE